jgi:hypothetical protein
MVVAYHSVTGAEVGYEGGGATDFALNILNVLYPETTSGVSTDSSLKRLGVCTKISSANLSHRRTQEREEYPSKIFDRG